MKNSISIHSRYNFLSFSSSKVGAADVNAYRMQYRKELEALTKKLNKDRQSQEKKFHMKLTALKQQRAEELV